METFNFYFTLHSANIMQNSFSDKAGISIGDSLDNGSIRESRKRFAITWIDNLQVSSLDE